MTMQPDLIAELAELRGEMVPADVVAALRAEADTERLGRMAAEDHAREMARRVYRWVGTVEDYVAGRATIAELHEALEDPGMRGTM